MIIVSNRIWVLGDNVDTDMLAPGRYMKNSVDVIAQHCLEALDPGFAETARENDVVVAGENFGMGSSREQAAEVLLYLGVRAVIAKSFGRIFYRNALNLGLPVLTCGDVDRIDGLAGSWILAVDHLDRFAAETLPQHGEIACFQCRLVHVELVRINCALNNSLAEPVGRRNEYCIPEA